MAGYQQTIIVGFVGKDVDFKFTQSGVALANFSVAVTRKFGGKDGAEKQEETTWFRVTAWRNLAEIANQWVKKGQQIMVVGTIKASAYMDKSGSAAASLELTADNFQMLGKKDGAGDADNESAPTAPKEDIPF